MCSSDLFITFHCAPKAMMKARALRKAAAASRATGSDETPALQAAAQHDTSA